MAGSLHGVALAALALLAASCASVRSPLALKPQRRGLPASDTVRRFPLDSTPVPTPSRWWESFESEELNHLMAQAFAGNLSVAAAWTRLRQARASAAMASTDGSIQLRGEAEAAGSRRHTRGEGTETSDRFSAGLTLSFELDIWGRIAAAARSSTLEVLASERDVHTTALALSGQLAQAWLQLCGARVELAKVLEQIETSRKALELLKRRQRKAMSAAVDVLQQQQQVAGLESAVPSLREAIAVYRIRIAHLLGRPADAELSLHGEALPSLPPAPAPGVPSELLANRPDVQSAWSRLRAQEWRVVEARAQRLPALTLTGTSGLDSPKVSQLLDSWVSGLAASLAGPILDGGRRTAEVRRGRALADERFLSYRDTVLTALGEVVEALVRERWRKEHLARLQEEADYAARTFDETQRRYRGGIGDYLPVLTALSSMQRAERALVIARSALLTNRVSLCQALGGTWMAELTETR